MSLSMNPFALFGKNHTLNAAAIDINISISEESSFGATLNAFKKELEKKDTAALFKRIRYIGRMYPLSDITNYDEFKAAFDEIFDQNLIDKVLASKETDWQSRGWRGRTLEGIIWFDDGGPNIYKIDYVTEKGMAKIKEIIDGDRAYLHSSLREFQTPVFEWILKPEKIRDDYSFLPEYTLRARIDYLGNDNYRIAIWRWGKDVNYLYHKNPKKEWSYDYIVGDMIFDTYFPAELVLENGKFESDGQLGDFSISFESPMGNLEIYTLYSSPDVEGPGVLSSSIPLISGEHYATKEISPADKQKNYALLKKLRTECCPNGEIPNMESFKYNWSSNRISPEMYTYAENSPHHIVIPPIEEYEDEFYQEEEQADNIYERKLNHLKKVKRYTVDDKHPSTSVIMNNGDSLYVSVESEACDIYHTFYTLYIKRKKLNHKKELISFANNMLEGYESLNKVKEYINTQKTIKAGFKGSIKIHDYLSYIIEVSDEEDGSCRIHIREN